jgi:ABC-type phosphate/phosphonate transport system substrate-binding protein
LADLILGLEQSEEGRAILRALGVDRFVPVDDGAYDGVRQIEQELGR